MDGPAKLGPKGAKCVTVISNPRNYSVLGFVGNAPNRVVNSGESVCHMDAAVVPGNCPTNHPRKPNVFEFQIPMAFGEGPVCAKTDDVKTAHARAMPFMEASYRDPMSSK
jgi:hypothetical protein